MANIGTTPSDLGALNPQTSPRSYTTIDELLKANKEDNRDLLVKSYGDQGITGFLELTGATKSAGTNDFIQWWEEPRRHKTYTVAGTPSGSTGQVTGITAINGLGKQDVVMNATTGEVFICTAVDGSGDANTFDRLDSGAANVSWTVGDKIIHLGNMYGQGEAGPAHFLETEPEKLTNSFMIVKDLYKVNGSQATNIGWVNVGGDYRWYIHGEQETRKRFLDRREMMMLFGSKAGDAAGTQSAGDTITDLNGDVAGSEGYFSAIKNRGIEVTNGAANPLDSFQEFDDIIIQLDKQGAPAEYAMYVNRTQDLAIDDMLAAGVATKVTAGLPGQFGAFQNNPDMAVQLGFKSFTRGGYTFHKHDWKLLNDPTLLGASDKFMGAMIPLAQVADPRTGTKAPALELNYKEANGYSRELEHWVRGGGVFGHNELADDIAEFHYRSEIALCVRAANQHVALKG